MRVPIPVVILLCFCVVVGVWWAGTRGHDFLTPPAGIQQTRIEKKNTDAIPQAEQPSDESLAAKTIEALPVPQPQNTSPQLADYRDRANDPALLLELARQLEKQGKLQQSLLAWERLIDSAVPDEARTTEAIQSIKRLRLVLPAWNTDPAKTIPITLHAGTGKSSAEILTPALDQIARDLELASSGILKITPVITAGNDIPQSRGPAPIALWFAGSGDESRSTEALILSIGPSEVLRDELLKSLFQIIRSHLGRNASLAIPAAADDSETPLESIHFRITRFGWLELGSSLNKTLE